MNTTDALHCNAALELAQSAIGLSDPNPRVGCVITSADGARVLGRGHTQAAGQAHAEVMALRDAAARGADVRGAHVYVTLEPCAHHGRTPPCCAALIAAGVGRVTAAVRDPNPAVAGQGMAQLQAAGIPTFWADDAIATEARELNVGFFSRMLRGRPWVRLKVAATLDGRTALPDGRSQWITGSAARADGHAWRRRAGAVVTGVGSVQADDPQLDVRLVATARQPLRVVLDSRWRTPPTARLFDAASPLVFYTAQPPQGDAARALHRRLLQHGGQAVICPNAAGRVNLHAVLADLARREINEVHLEAGAALNAAWLAAGLVDELLLYVAPMLIGPGRALADVPPLPGLDAAPRWRWHEVSAIGDDLRLRLRRVDGPLE